MTTVNKRIRTPMANTINGIAAGGLVSHRIQAGFDDINQNPVDGNQLPMVDMLTEFVRGDAVSQDWVHVIELLTGTVGTDVFYERKIGVAEASGYIKHTLLNPIIHRIVLALSHRKYGTVNYSYECKAADENDGMTELWSITDSQSAPTHLDAVKALEIVSCQLGVLNIYHVMGLDLTIELPLLKLSADGDLGYTTVEAILNGMKINGTLRFQDADISTSQIKAMQLMKAARGSLVLSVKQAQEVAAKTLTIAGVKFIGPAEHAPSNPDSGQVPNPDEFSVPFMITDSSATQLTLAGANKVITIS
jgi:hypothetical protein